LWAALRAKERDPGRRVTLVDSGACGDGASGRNGGFVDPSLTHGFANGLSRWPDEMPELLRLGSANLAGLVETVRRYDIDCHLEHSGELLVATRPHEVEAIADEVAKPAATDATSGCSTATRLRRACTRPPTSPAGTTPRWYSSSRHGWHGACAAHASTSVSRCTSTLR
jgi:glycine/D-amino acid oxidase-like deaminating enzyme